MLSLSLRVMLSLPLRVMLSLPLRVILSLSKEALLNNFFQLYYLFKFELYLKINKKVP